MSYRWNLSVHYSGLMTLEWGAGRFPEAEPPARRALELAEGISAKVPVRVDYRALAAHRRFEWADLLSNTGRTPQAIPVCEKTLAEYEALVRDCPVVPEYRHSLTQLLTRVGDRLRVEGKLEAAESAYARSLPLAEGLARDFPEVPSYRIGPVAVRTSLAKLAVKKRDAATARKLLEPSLRELDGELKKHPNEGYAHSYRNTVLGYLARVQALQDDARAASATARLMEESARDPMEYYNAACYLSLLWKDVKDAPTAGPERDELTKTLTDRAVAQLRKAKDAGLKSIPVMLEDTDFDPIRDSPQFKGFQSEVAPPKPVDKNY